MSIGTKAIYEGCILKPAQDLSLASGEEVEIVIGRPVSRTNGIVNYHPVIVVACS